MSPKARARSSPASATASKIYGINYSYRAVYNLRALYKGRFYDVELAEEPKGRSHAPEVLREIIAKTLKTAGKTGSD